MKATISGMKSDPLEVIIHFNDDDGVGTTFDQDERWTLTIVEQLGAFWNDAYDGSLEWYQRAMNRRISERIVAPGYVKHFRKAQADVATPGTTTGETVAAANA